MNNRRLSFFSVAAVILLSSCVTTQSARPLWADSETIEQVYPQTDYIARIGASQLENGAAPMADSELASFFSHNVKSQTSAVQIMSAGKEGTAVESELTRNVTVESTMRLFAVTHTKTWYDKSSDMYFCCSYINRKEAWTVYEPKVIQAKKAFMSKYNQAEDEFDPIKKIRLYFECVPYAQSYLKTLDFAHILYEAGEKQYSSDRDLIGSLGKLVSEAKMAAVMYVSVNNDLDGKIKGVVSSLLSKDGFFLSETAYVYTIKVNINFNKQNFEQTVVARPDISIAVSNGLEDIYSYNKNFSTISGFKEAEFLVDKRVYDAIEKELNVSFINEFEGGIL